jgi:AraC-like DNA-binding protein
MLRVKRLRSQRYRVSSGMERMAENGTATFSSPDDYQAGIRGATSKRANINFIVTRGGDFRARLTWLNLHSLRVLRGSENLPGIAYVTLPPERVVVLFPTSTVPLIWGGRELRFGDIVFHSRGERTHQWTSGQGRWGLISLPPDQLAACGLALTGRKITAPPFRRVLRPPGSAASLLLRLHAKVCRLAETRHELITNPEVTRALEQELLHALVNCLTADEADSRSETLRHHAGIMARFEEALAVHAGGHLNISALCAELGVPERTLRVCCVEFLGMSPARYVLLRRLNKARAALRRADPATASVAGIARSCQFSEPGRFAVIYRTVFGELPSVTLRTIA